MKRRFDLNDKKLGCTMGISQVRMVDLISEEDSIAFQKEYKKRSHELIPDALNVFLTRSGPESLLNIAVHRN